MFAAQKVFFGLEVESAGMLARKVQATAISDRVARGWRGVKWVYWVRQQYGIMFEEARWFMQEQEKANKARMVGYVIGIVCIVATLAWKLVVR